MSTTLEKYQRQADRTSSASELVLATMPDFTFGSVDRTTQPSRAAWRVANGAVGMAAEAGELCGVVLANNVHEIMGYPVNDVQGIEAKVRAAICKELGDIMWYVAESASALGFKLSSIDSSIPLIRHDEVSLLALQLAHVAGEASDYLKKLLWHGKAVDWAIVSLNFARVIDAVIYLGDAYGLTLEEICTTNITKLKVRYATGFSPEASEARVDLI